MICKRFFAEEIEKEFVLRAFRVILEDTHPLEHQSWNEPLVWLNRFMRKHAIKGMLYL